MIERNSDSNNDVLKLDINNGDLEALKKAVERFGFKNEESLLRYALAVLTKSAVSSLTITDSGGQKTALYPADSLLKPKTEIQPAS